MNDTVIPCASCAGDNCLFLQLSSHIDALAFVLAFGDLFD